MSHMNKYQHAVFSCFSVVPYLCSQISRHQKFGYGVLVTQVASTAAGAVALQNSGKVFLLIRIIIILNKMSKPMGNLTGTIKYQNIYLKAVFLELGLREKKVTGFPFYLFSSMNRTGNFFSCENMYNFVVSSEQWHIMN